MAKKKDLVQEIAVFGESGSGKTVLVSSFYGLTQERAYADANPFDIFPSDPDQKNVLAQRYLKMRNSAEAPIPTRFELTSYEFAVDLKGKPAKSASTLTMIWHDYPGEWFSSDGPSGEEESTRRVAAFRRLMGSSVALLLIDGQSLLDNAGQEERYLKSVLWSYKNRFQQIKKDVLVNGQPLERFPRIWIFALSKSDLHPDLDVEGFRNLLDEKVGDDIVELRRTIAGFVQAPEALSVGENYIRLSSAEFSPGQIDLSKRIGLDLVLPIAAVLPLEWHARWAQIAAVPRKIAHELLSDDLVAPVLDFAAKFVPILAKKLPQPIPSLLERALKHEIVKRFVESGVDELIRLNKEALARNDYAGATLSKLMIDLDRGERAKVLLRGVRSK